MKATPGQIRRIYGLMPAYIKADPKMKADLVSKYTGNRELSSVKDLEVGQAKTLISDLLRINPDDRMRKKFLSMCHELRWYLPGTTTLDWPRIGNWLEKYGHLHFRQLNRYTGKDLATLLTQFEGVVRSSYQSGVGSKE